MTPMDIILDCDPGIDDALALALAVATPELNLCAVTCVAGNRPVETTARNARALLDLFGAPDIPVYAGAPGPLDNATAQFNLVHGEDGLGGVDIDRSGIVADGHAADVLAEALLSEARAKLTVVATGPLTNLALAETRHPGILARARRPSHGRRHVLSRQCHGGGRIQFLCRRWGCGDRRAVRRGAPDLPARRDQRCCHDARLAATIGEPRDAVHAGLDGNAPRLRCAGSSAPRCLSCRRADRPNAVQWRDGLPQDRKRLALYRRALLVSSGPVLNQSLLRDTARTSSGGHRRKTNGVTIAIGPPLERSYKSK